MIEVNRNPSPKVLRQFAGIWLPLFGALAGASAWRGVHPTAAVAIWSVAAVLALVSLMSRPAARLVFLSLSYLALPVGLVVSWIALAIVFFAVITPLGLVRRLLGHDALRLRNDRTARTFWQARPERPDVTRALRQF